MIMNGNSGIYFVVSFFLLQVFGIKLFVVLASASLCPVYAVVSPNENVPIFEKLHVL